MKEYKVGFLGFGFIGKVHAYGYLNLPLYYDPVPLKARVSHICTAHRETAEAGCRMVGADHAVLDYREITENPEIDIVHICTPNHLHKEALLSAMKNQKHIYCDKPLVSQWKEALEIQEALSSYKGVSQMTFQNRFFPSTMKAKQLMDEGFVGQVLEFRACYLHAGSADPKTPLKWKLSARAGGGVIADLASHVLDLLYMLLGEYGAFLAATHIAYDQRPSQEDPSVYVSVDAEDCVMLLARMASGALGFVEATKIATGTEDELRVEIHGSRGAIRYNGMDPHHLEVYDATATDCPLGGKRGWLKLDVGQRYPAPASGFPGGKIVIGWMRGHMACLANFLQCVDQCRPADPGLEQGIYVQRLMDTIRRSAEEGCWKSMNPRLCEDLLLSESGD